MCPQFTVIKREILTSVRVGTDWNSEEQLLRGLLEAALSYTARAPVACDDPHVWWVHIRGA